MARLMLVEDDEAIGELLVGALRANGHTVTWQRTGASALVEAGQARLDLVLLDLGLPDVDGVDVCRDLRLAQPDSVLVMLTARKHEMDVVVGLEAGADDYLTKPFGLTELLARVRAHLRRHTVDDGSETSPTEVDDLRLDLAARRVYVGETEVELRPKELDLLARLAQSAGRAVSRETLMADVWDARWAGSTRTLDVHVAAVRRRLAEAAVGRSRVPRITTLRGFGYRLDPYGRSPQP